MLVPNPILIAIAEVNLVLLIGLIAFFLHSRKLKALLRRQQKKLVELLNSEPPATTAPLSAVQNYKAYLNKELDATATKFDSIALGEDIAEEPPKDKPHLQRILALRYAFLRAEEIGTTEETGSEAYWNLFTETLSPLLGNDQHTNNASNEELETAKKRIDNLEKFKKLFFDLEKQWNEAQLNSQDYYAQLLALSEDAKDPDAFKHTLNQYHEQYDGIHNHFQALQKNPDTAPQKIINITRQDPRAADEIIKLRNVAADQHRIINQLQKKLMDAKTTEEKELVIEELQQQLQRQTRFVQESETCVQLLEEELNKAQDELNVKEKMLKETSTLGEENQIIKSTLQSFTLESKDMMHNINELEKENIDLKKNIEVTLTKAPVAEPADTASEIVAIQSEFMDLKKQYAELEEKYLELKLG